MTEQSADYALCEPEHRCIRCNNFRDPSDLSYINEVPFCHGEFDRSPTCFQRTVLEGPSKAPAHVNAALSGASAEGAES